jgi:hypothetical protein
MSNPNSLPHIQPCACAACNNLDELIDGWRDTRNKDTEDDDFFDDSED